MPRRRPTPRLSARFLQTQQEGESTTFTFAARPFARQFFSDDVVGQAGR